MSPPIAISPPPASHTKPTHPSTPGDTIHLAHVICNPRTPSVPVGSSGVGTQWEPSRDEAVFAREFMLRLEHEAQTMMAARFVPSLQFKGIDHVVDLLRLRVHKSAASIGEALSQRATDLGADMIVIASHGAGVLADYGSVARWCSENSPVPTLLLTPAVLAGAAPGLPTSNAVVVAAVDDVSGLKHAFDFATQQLTRPGDEVYALLARAAPDEAAAVATRKQLIASVHRWLEESPVEHARTLNVAVDLVTEATCVPGGGMDAAAEGAGPAAGGAPSPAGAALCDMARGLGARAVVLQHHGRSMMAEMMYGPVILTVTKHCDRPLVVLGATPPLASPEDKSS